MWPEFKAFLTKSNALALAVGVIIGAAMGKVVTALVGDLIMPVVGVILPKGDWRDAQIVLSKSTDAAGKVTVNAIKYGDLFGAIVDFLIISFMAFLLTRALLKPAPEVPVKTCPYCKEKNDEAASKCKACTSEI